VIKVVSSTDKSYYPVVDHEQKLAGMITLDAMRSTFATQELNDWLVALDLMEPGVTTLSPDAPLSEGLEQIKRFEAEQIPVLDSRQGGRLVGVLEGRAVQRRLKAEVLAKQQKAYST
jgi:CBS domain-containing protein